MKTLLAVPILVSAVTFNALAQNSAFTYQGRLADGGTPVSGIYDLRFTLHDQAAGGSEIAGPLTNSPTGVSNGIFTVSLDFGSVVFNGSARWLEISVRTNGGAGFTTLSPRTEITPTPYALHAQSLSASGLAGTYGGAVTLNNPANQFSGSFSGNGGALTNVNATTLSGLVSSNFWQIGGNVGTTAGLNFVGTTDNQPLELKVNGMRALRLEPAAETPNLVGGTVSNSVANGIQGATIAGGGLPLYPNQITADYAAIGGGTFHIAGGAWSTIAGGRDNRAYAESSTVAGGWANVVRSNSPYATVGGGVQNVAASGEATVSGGVFNQALGFSSTIGGGGANSAEGPWATVAGGRVNTNQWNAIYGTISGGVNNQVGSNVVAGTVGGGENNRATANHAIVAGGLNNVNSGPGATIGGGNGNVAAANDAVIGGGIFNQIGTNAFSSTLSGGRENMILAGSQLATIGGGYLNRAAGNETTVAGGALNDALAPASTVGGGHNNFAAGGHSTIAGGRDGIVGTNSSYATIGGGQLNRISESSSSATIAGGEQNLIGPNSLHSTISGGAGNIIETNTSTATISGGWLNRVGEHALNGTVGGGYQNRLGTNAIGSTIAGGDQNTIRDDAWRASIGGGNFNAINAFIGGTIAGGVSNTLTSAGSYSAIGGGQSNTVNANWSSIPGGRDNSVSGSYSLAAGRRAKASSSGTFIWADATDTDFTSTGANQFLIRANGGVGINTNNPTAQLHIGGTPGVDGIRFPDGTLQTTAAVAPAPPAVYFTNAVGANPATTNAFLAAPVTVTVTSASQKILVTSHKALGSTSAGGAINLNLYVGVRTAGSTASPTPVGSGVFGNRVATNTRITMGLSAVVTGLAPGNYQVGLMGSSSDAANWNFNEFSYTTATVY